MDVVGLFIEVGAGVNDILAELLFQPIDGQPLEIGDPLVLVDPFIENRSRVGIEPLFVGGQNDFAHRAVPRGTPRIARPFRQAVLEVLFTLALLQSLQLRRKVLELHLGYLGQGFRRPVLISDQQAVWCWRMFQDMAGITPGALAVLLIPGEVFRADPLKTQDNREAGIKR